MSCNNKHQLLDLYFHEGEPGRMAEINEHAARCTECRIYLASIKQTLSLLSEVGEEEPSANVMTGILSEIAVSQPKLSHNKTGVNVVPIIQIAFGEILVIALIYFIKIQISFSSLWEILGQYRIVQSIGSLGVAVIIVLLAGSFITLALAPILLMEADKKFSS
jgi:predicted anti-sigma-YlaC factor YlaD